VESESPTSKSDPVAPRKAKAQGNYIDGFIKKMFGQVLVFVDFLIHYADQGFVSQIDLKRLRPAPTHYIGAKGDERIVDLVFRCPLKNGDGTLTAVIIFEHQSTGLKAIPEKLIRYISAIWDAERKEGKRVLSAPYFLVLRTGKKPHGKPYPTLETVLPKGSDGEPLGHVPDIKYKVVDLPAWNFDKLTGGAVLRSTLMMLHRITGGQLDDFPEASRPLLELPEGERMGVTKGMLDFVAKAFAVHNRILDEATVSAAVETIFKGKEKAMIKTIFEEREAKGKAEGKVEGKAEGKAETVVKILRARFKKVPKDVEKAILAMNDPVALDSWAVHAATCETLDEFAEGLR
jgi:hypothetical protein